MSAGNKLQYNNICGRFQKFCTLYFFSLKMNLFYKIHLQAFNVICIVLYHSSPTFWQILYSCQDAFVVDRSNYLGHLIRHLLNASEAFPTKWFLQSVSSSVSRLCFAEQGPRSLRICTQCSLLKCGSQLSRKSEWLHHPTGYASAVCRTFEMTYVYLEALFFHVTVDRTSNLTLNNMFFEKLRI